jgi:hypothetical protein
MFSLVYFSRDDMLLMADEWYCFWIVKRHKGTSSTILEGMPCMEALQVIYKQSIVSGANLNLKMSRCRLTFSRYVRTSLSMDFIGFTYTYVGPWTGFNSTYAAVGRPACGSAFGSTVDTKAPVGSH